MNNDFTSKDSKIDYSDLDKYYEDYYRELRKSILVKICKNYPKINFESLELSFSINVNAKNAFLVYTVLQSLPNELYSIDKEKIDVFIESEIKMIECFSTVSDLLLIVKSWKSMVFKVNDIIINPGTEFFYFTETLFEKNDMEKPRQCADIADIKDKYGIKQKYYRTITTKDKDAVVISRDNYEASFNTVITKYINKFCNNQAVEYFELSDHEIIIKVEDNLIVDFRLLPNYWAQMRSDSYEKWENPHVTIQELTYNNLFDFNYTGFRRGFKYDHMGIDFYPFHGFKYYISEIDRFDVVNRAFPELELEERMNRYEGETHHFVILRMEDVDGRISYGIGDTKGKVHNYIQRLCKEFAEKNPRSLDAHGASCLVCDCGFTSAFTSWKGKSKIWRLENKFSYYYEDVKVKSDTELLSLPQKIAKKAIDGAYEHCEFGTYSKPLNKWKSEEQVYNIVKKIYKDYQVIYQYRPYYLSTGSGNMSYDIYICGLRIAIEYQGKQHFEPVQYFGGEKSFKQQQERDKLKAQRSKENGVKLIYVNYWEDITMDSIRKKIEEAINTTSN